MQAAEGILEGKFDDAGGDDDDFLEVAVSLQESKKTVCVGFSYFLDSEHRLCSTIRYGSLRCGLIDTGR